MPRLVLGYLIFFLAIYLVVYYVRQRKRSLPQNTDSPRRKFRTKLEKDLWIQVFDTDSLDEGKQVIARLEEENIECLFYEQGRKDVHGNRLKGYGIVVLKTSVARAQNLISRLPV